MNYKLVEYVIENLTEILALIAAIAGIGAFWVSWLEIRRCNKVLVKLKKFSSCYSQLVPMRWTVSSME